MTNDKSIAVVGDRASIIIFNTAGVTVKAVDSVASAQTAVRELASDGYKIIYVSERYTDAISDLMEKYREYAYPAIIPIPDAMGSTGYGTKKVIYNMEKAIGTNIFDK